MNPYAPIPHQTERGVFAFMGAMDKRKGRKTTKLDRFSVKSDFSLDLMFERFYYAKVAEGSKERTLKSYRENYKFLTDYLDSRGIGRDVRNVTRAC
ncbi:hypothetical protein AAFJ72_14765 [Brevibacillus gelatini]|uniref:hypothetical protein n=1 Tax=Brevibacillus gelatini TaxID=1655277 RepID=UPI003D818C1D